MNLSKIALSCCVLGVSMAATACGATPEGNDSPTDIGGDAVATQGLLPPVAVPGEGHDLSKLQLAPPGSQWVMTQRGGSGGAVTKLQGVVIYAIQVNSGTRIDRLQLAYYIPSGSDNQYRTGDFYGTIGPLGGNGGAFNDWDYCPGGFGAIGIQGRSGTMVDALGLVCSNATTPSPNTEVTLPVHGGGGGQFFYDDCGNGNLMVGANIRSGTMIDQIQGICNHAH